MISSVFGPLIVFVLRSRSESANNCSNKCAIAFVRVYAKDLSVLFVEGFFYVLYMY